MWFKISDHVTDFINTCVNVKDGVRTAGDCSEELLSFKRSFEGWLFSGFPCRNLQILSITFLKRQVNNCQIGYLYKLLFETISYTLLTFFFFSVTSGNFIVLDRFDFFPLLSPSLWSLWNSLSGNRSPALFLFPF